MLIQPRPPLTIPVLFSPLVVAVVLVGLCALLKEPTRQKFSAIFLAGAGAAYLSGGFWYMGVRILRGDHPARLSRVGELPRDRARVGSAHLLGRRAPPLRQPNYPLRAPLVRRR